MLKFFGTISAKVSAKNNLVKDMVYLVTEYKN